MQRGTAVAASDSSRRVWRAAISFACLCLHPSTRARATCTYGDVASALGEPGAARAVGQALGSNPFAPIVPCHRVLAAGRAAGGFSGGQGAITKLQMLEIEGGAWGGTLSLFAD